LTPGSDTGEEKDLGTADHPGTEDHLTPGQGVTLATLSPGPDLVSDTTPMDNHTNRTRDWAPQIPQNLLNGCLNRVKAALAMTKCYLCYDCNLQTFLQCWKQKGLVRAKPLPVLTEMLTGIRIRPKVTLMVYWKLENPVVLPLLESCAG
jgi:hypothetical protein